MNTGKFGAFDRMTPPNSDISQTIVQQERLNNQYNAEKERKADKLSQENLKTSSQISKINSGAKTGYNHIDSAFADAYQRKGGLIEQYTNAVKRLKDSNNTDSEAFGIIRNIEGFTDKLSQMKSGFGKISSTLQQGIAEGKYSSELNKGYLSNMKKIEEGNIFINTDDISNISIDNLGKDIDFDGDGIADKITMETFSDARNFGVWEADFDVNNFISGLDKKYKTFEEVTVDGYKTITKKGFNPENTLFLKDDLRNTLGKDVNSITNAGKSYLIQNGLSLKEVKEKPELYDKLINDTATKYISTRQVSKKEDFDYTAKRLANKQYSDSKKSTETTSNINPMTENGKPLERDLNGKKYKGYAVGRKMSSGDIDNEVKIARGDDQVYVKEYYISDDGKIAFSGRKQQMMLEYWQDPKDAKKTIQKRTGKLEWSKTDGTLNETEANQLAVSLGYKNVSDLLDAHKVSKPESKTEKTETSNKKQTKSLVLDNVPEGGF